MWVAWSKAQRQARSRGAKGMRDVRRILGACVVVVSALAAVGPGVASATEYPVTGVPEIGRCVSQPGTGGFRGTRPKCILVSHTHTGNFEWHPGPGANGTIKIKLSNPVFETTGGERIGCSFLFANGGIADGKTAKITEVVLQGCGLVGPNYQCFSNT